MLLPGYQSVGVLPQRTAGAFAEAGPAEAAAGLPGGRTARAFEEAGPAEAAAGLLGGRTAGAFAEAGPAEAAAASLAALALLRLDSSRIMRWPLSSFLAFFGGASVSATAGCAGPGGSGAVSATVGCARPGDSGAGFVTSRGGGPGRLAALGLEAAARAWWTAEAAGRAPTASWGPGAGGPLSAECPGGGPGGGGGGGPVAAES